MDMAHVRRLNAAAARRYQARQRGEDVPLRRDGPPAWSQEARLATVPVRFHAKVEPEPNTGCWLWIGARLRDGYGELFVNRVVRRAHLVAYTLYRGPIPIGLEADHTCRVRSCVNPWHLEFVTHVENIRRATFRNRSR